MKNTQKPRNPNADLRSRKVKHLRPRLFCRRSPLFSRPNQVDAAAKVDEDEVLYDGGGARATVRLREEEDKEREE